MLSVILFVGQNLAIFFYNSLYLVPANNESTEVQNPQWCNGLVIVYQM